MQLSPEDQKRYPKFKHFLYVTAPRLANTSVVAEMVDLTGLRAGKIRDALTPGSLPKVIIVENLICRGSAAGCFRHDMPDQLEVNRELVVGDEKGLRSVPGWEDRSVAGIKLRHSHVTVLHELVHWADFKANARSTTAPAPYHDVGSRWEWMVFSVFDESMVHSSP